MKKIKRLFSNVKNSAETSSLRGSLGKRNSSLSSVTGHSLHYDIKPKELDKIHKAVINQDEKKVELLAPKYVNTRDKGDRTPLHLACAIGNAAIVEKLLSWKALINVPDRENKTPLFKAIECGHEDCAKLLIQTKVGLTVYDKDGNSCLHHLCIHGMNDLVPLVLDKLTVADVEKKNKFGQNPLHIAIEKSNTSTVEMLLKKGVNADTYNQNNITPLMMACYRGHKEVILLLLKYNSNPSLKDSNGNTAADLAMKMGHEECVKAIEFFKEREDDEADATDNDDDRPVIEDYSKRAEVMVTKEIEPMEREEEVGSGDESESETNDFYKGKSNFMLSKILMDDIRKVEKRRGDNHDGDISNVKRNINEKQRKDDDDDDGDEEGNESEASVLSREKGKSILSQLRNQTSFDGTKGLTSNTAVPSNMDTGYPNGNILQTFEDDDGSCWDSENEDIPGSAQMERQDGMHGGQPGGTTFTLSEIKYPVLTEAFEHLSSQSLNSGEYEIRTIPPQKPERQSQEDLYHESSDEDPAPIPTFEQKKRDRRSSSIENQIGSFIKSESKEIVRKNSLKEEKSMKKSFDEDWDSVSEISSKTSGHEKLLEAKEQSSLNVPRPINEASSLGGTSHAATSTDGNLLEDAVKLNEEIKNLKEEISNLKNVATLRDAEMEQLTRKSKMLEDENSKLKLKTLENDSDVGTSQKEISILQSKLNQTINEKNELKELNDDLKNKLNVGNMSLEQMMQNHKIEVFSLKNELNDLEHKLQQTNFQVAQDCHKDNESRTKNLKEKLKHRMDVCKEQESKLDEQKSKLMKLEIENSSLKMSLDGKKERCLEVEEEMKRLTTQHENVLKDLLAEKDKSIKMNVKDYQEKIDALEIDLENSRKIKPLTSSEVFLKAEQEQKVSLLEESNEDLKCLMSKLREELDLQRDKHERECKSLTSIKNDLFNKLVLSESSLKKDSMSKQFLENEIGRLNREAEKLKQKLSEEQGQRQAAELKMISMNQLMEASKSSSINVESKLSQKSESLMNVEKENESLKESLHALELENVKLLTKFKMEEQLKEELREELIELKHKLSDSLRESYEQLKTKKQLQEKVQNLTGSKDLAVMEAENQRELWENEIKTKSKLGLRLYQLDHENRGILTKLTQEQMKLRKALERNEYLNKELRLEKQRGNMLSQKLEEFNDNPVNLSKSKVKYNHSRYFVDSAKKSRTNDENRNIGIDLMKEIDKMKKEIEQKTQAEFVEKLHQVYQFLEEQAIIRSQNEQKRMENMELFQKNLLNNGGQSTVSLRNTFSFSENPSKVQSLFDDFKI